MEPPGVRGAAAPRMPGAPEPGIAGLFKDLLGEESVLPVEQQMAPEVESSGEDEAETDDGGDDEEEEEEDVEGRTPQWIDTSNIIVGNSTIQFTRQRKI